VAVQVSAPAAANLGGGAHAMKFRIGLLKTDSSHDEAAHEVTEKSTFVVPR
jgi:hypothetical protein